MWSIAIKTLLADRGKMLTALVGVVFSVVLINVQGGLFYGLLRKASLLVENGDADIWVGHREMYNVDFGRRIPARWINRIRSLPGVEAAEPYVVGVCEISFPNGQFETVMLVGVEKSNLLGNVKTMAIGSPLDILKTDGIVLDACDADRFGYPQIGDICELGGKRARIVGLSYGFLGFVVTPFCFTTLDRATDYLNLDSDLSTYFLVQVAPGADVEAVRAEIQHRLPDAAVFRSDEFSWASRKFWLTRTGLGISFGAATLLGLLVGMIIVAQTLYALVLDRLEEFGTLKAIGATERHIFSILFLQALSMATIGSMVGLLAVAGIQQYYSTPRAPIVIPAWLSWGSCALVVIICLISSLLPYLRIRRVDPLLVMQS